MATFPSLTPSSRQFTPGQLPVKRYESLSGTVWKRVFGNRPTAHKLGMEFSNVKDFVARQIVDHYYGQNTTVDSFSLPSASMTGVEDTALLNFMRSPTNNLWVYAGPPQVRSVFPGISTVSVELEAELTY